MRNFGFSGLDTVIELGTNGKLNEISAAMGLTLLDEIEALLAANRRTYLQFQEGLKAVPGLRLLPLDTIANNCQYAVVEVDERQGGLTRNAIVEILRRENVLARRYFYPGIHRMPPYRGRSHAPLPVTERLAETVLVLPGGVLADGEVDLICSLLQLLARHAGEIANQLHKIV
jgi:dTDP-4-amino-4,6-dideoxygalactose transaminase